MIQVTKDPTDVRIVFPSGEGLTVRAGWDSDGRQTVSLIPDDGVHLAGEMPGEYVVESTEATR